MMFSEDMLQDFNRRYEEDGVVFVPELLSRPWVEKLKTAIDEVLANHAVGASNGNLIKVNVRRGQKTIHWMSRDRADVRSFAADSGVAGTVARVIGSRSLKFWFDNTFIHEPDTEGAFGTPWHHDIAAFPIKGMHIPSVWIALSDVGADQSPLSCVRGSHKNTQVMFKPPVNIDPTITLPAGYGTLPDVDHLIATGQVNLITFTDIKAGDALVIHPYTLHGARGNASKVNRRIAFTTRWAGDDVVWRHDAYSMAVPGIDLATVTPGTRPEGAYFPEILRP